MTYLFISHDLRVVRALADDLAVMQDGVIVEQGPAEQIFSQPRHPTPRPCWPPPYCTAASPW